VPIWDLASKMVRVGSQRGMGLSVRVPRGGMVSSSKLEALGQIRSGFPGNRAVTPGGTLTCLEYSTAGIGGAAHWHVRSSAEDGKAVP